MSPRRWPWQPLHDLLVARLGPPSVEGTGGPGNHTASTGATTANIARLLCTTRSNIDHYVARGSLPTTAADRAAIALGLHPVLIWTDWCDPQPHRDQEDTDVHL